jgi:hypothetical protein
MPILRTLCYNGSLVTWTVVSLAAEKFKPLIFNWQLRVRVTLRLAVYHQSVRLGDKPLRLTTSIFFSTEHFRSWSLPYNILSEERMGLSFTSADGPRQRLTELESSRDYLTTDDPSASLSCNKAHIWGLRADFYYCQTVAGLLMWSALSDERTGLLFTIVAGPCQRVRVPWDSRPYFAVSDLRLDSQGHGGGIRPRLHTG